VSGAVPTRRQWLQASGALGATALLGCHSSSAPAPSIVSLTSRRVIQSLPGMATVDGAGVRLTRIIGQPALRNLDPFVLLDRMHSDDPSAYIKGFPDHPHRGFETVSVMLSGRIRHRDSRGNHGLITGGGAQWMTAGRGIVHSEMPEPEPNSAQGPGTMLHGFQLWVNLPAREKMCPQYYQDLSPDRLAEVSLSSTGSKARFIAGHDSALAGPVRERPTDPTLLTLELADDAPFVLDVPSGHTAFAFVYGGSVRIGEDGASTRVGQGTLALLGPGNRVRLRATEETSGVLVAAGRPLNEPLVQRGPFVMNTDAEIEQAFADYRAGILDRS
jgi:redox-sensitive bicupin YhaK (pirin superfamily)